MAQLFTNNSASTLAVAMSNSVLSVVVASGEGALFASPAFGDWQMVTLSDPVTGAYEVVKMTARSGDNMSVARAQEGTVGVAWPIGTKVEARITAGTLAYFLGNLSQSADGVAAGKFAQDVGVGRPFLASTAYEVGDVVRSFDGDLGVVVIAGTNSASPLTNFSGFDGFFGGVIYVNSGTVGVARIGLASYLSEQIAIGYKAYGIDNAVAVGRRSTAGADGAVAVGHRALSTSIGGVAVGRETFATGGGVAVGFQAKGTGSGSTVVGGNAGATGNNATVVGQGATGNAANSVAIGSLAQATGSGSVAIGYSARNKTDNSFAFGGTLPSRQREVQFLGHFIMARDNYTAGFGSYKVAGAESAFGSVYMELGTPATWAASTSYKDGDVVQPTTPNGLQYHLVVGPYNSAALPNTITSTAVEPTWATSPQDYTDADAGETAGWIGADLSVGHDETFPPNTIFFPTEIGFYCSQYSSVTAAPFVSIGTMASPTLLVNNQQLSDITAANMRHVFAVLKHGITDLRIRLEAPATGAGAKFFGKFYAKGLFVPTQG